MLRSCNRGLLVVGIVLISCRQNDPGKQAAREPVDTVVASALDIARRHFAQVPDSVLLRNGACPFECCVYGQWRAITAIPTLQTPSSTAVSTFVIDSGMRFRADTGFVRITGPAIIAVDDTVFVGAERRVRFLPGDTVVVLNYLGEGHWNLWQRGRVVESVEGFWGAEIDSPRGSYYGDYQKEWWVRARLADGRAGWFRADSTFRYSGADACSGPIN